MRFLVSIIASILWAPFVLTSYLPLLGRQGAPPVCTNPVDGNPCNWWETAQCCQDANNLYLCVNNGPGHSSTWGHVACAGTNNCIWKQEEWCCSENVDSNRCNN